MLEKYDINDLFLASIDVEYSPYGNSFDTNVGGILLSGVSGYGYITILKKEDGHYIDLQNKFLEVPSVDSNGRSYNISYIEPLSKYYFQQKKSVLSRKKSILTAKKYINDFHQSHLKQIK